jgi:hypothetical protein
MLAATERLIDSASYAIRSSSSTSRLLLRVALSKLI